MKPEDQEKYFKMALSYETNFSALLYLLKLMPEEHIAIVQKTVADLDNIRFIYETLLNNEHDLKRINELQKRFEAILPELEKSIAAIPDKEKVFKT